MAKRWIVLLLALCLALAACGGGDSEDEGDDSDEASQEEEFGGPVGDVEAYPVFVTSEVVVGPNRFLVGLLDGNDAPLSSPDIEVGIDFFDLKESKKEPVFSTDTEFLRIDEARGLYKANVEFPRAGMWGAAVTIEGEGIDERVTGSFEVVEDPSSPALGEKVPASDTLTADDAGSLSEISTDKNPDPRFYQLSIADAVKAKEPFVVTFATPKFCQSATCAPMFGIVKDVAADFPKLTFIHVEPYDLTKVPEALEPVEVMFEWGLLGEPWVFVMDANGEVVAKFEGVMAPDELQGTLKKL